MQRLHLRIAVLGGEFIPALDRFLRFYGKFAQRIAIYILHFFELLFAMRYCAEASQEIGRRSILSDEASELFDTRHISASPIALRRELKTNLATGTCFEPTPQDRVQCSS